MNIFVYKTNIESEQDLRAIEALLARHRGIIRWNVDREDVDKVLRVVSMTDDATALRDAVNKAGYFCEELAD